MIYAVIPLQDNEAYRTELEARIEKLKNEGSVSQPLSPIPVYSDYAPKAYFVGYNGTSRELSEKLGYGGESENLIGLGIVVEIRNYYGYASQTLWDWMRVYNV